MQFVRVHQILLNILIGKAGLFNTVPLIGAPVAAILRQIEKVVDVSAHLFWKSTARGLAILLYILIPYRQSLTASST